MQAHAVGLQQDREGHQRQQHEKRLDRKGGVAPQEYDDFCEYADHQQVNPRQHNRE